MKKINFKYYITFALIGFMCVVITSCDRGISEDFELATFPVSGDIFTDAPVGLTDQFFESFDPATGANTEAFGVDNVEVYKGTSSIRIDVPGPTDPNGGYIGGIFKDRGDGRDLSSFDALTFWAKGSTTTTIDQVGFGTDFEESKYFVNLSDLELTTVWKKYYIPIPDPSKLVQEKGMFLFAAGSTNNNGEGFTFWIDELRFESLGTAGQPRPSILGGQDQTAQGNVGIELPVTSLFHTMNMPNGIDVTVEAAPAYFDFETSNPFVASVNEAGVVSIDGPGNIDPDTGLLDNTAIITASVGGVEAAGAMIVEAVDLEIISIFSDVYANVAVDNYNGFYQPFQTTIGGAFDDGGNNIIAYDLLNFVAIEFYGREGSGVQAIDATEMTHLHIDVRVNEELEASDYINMQLHNNFTLGNEVNGVFTMTGADLTSYEWVQFDIPLSSFAGLTEREAIGMILFVSDATISNVSLDNIFFYSE